MQAHSRKRLQLNNQGVSLLMVLVIITFVTVLSAAALTVTVANIRIKQVDKTAKKNFYDTEQAMSEIYTGIGHQVMAAAEDAYQSTLNQMSSYDAVGGIYVKNTDSVAEAFQNKYFERIKALYPSGRPVSDTANLLLAFTSPQSGTLVLTLDSVVTDETEKTVTLKGLKAAYTDAGGYYTSVKTDIVITSPSATLISGSHAAAGDDFGELLTYALVAEEDINVRSSVNIFGNIYTGKNMLFYKDLTSILISVSADKILLGEEFSVRYATVNVFPMASEVNLCAKNITAGLKNETGASMTFRHKLNVVDGNLRIKDDMELNGNGSSVAMTGSYTGYGNQGSTHEGSSAVIINGMNTMLDLSGLSRLTLGGVAYIDLGIGASDTDRYSYATGEALSLKSTQQAYLAEHTEVWLKKDAHTMVLESNPILKSAVSGYSLVNPSAYRQIAVGDYYYYFVNSTDAALAFQTYADAHLAELADASKAYMVEKVLIPDLDKIYAGGTISAVPSRGSLEVHTPANTPDSSDITRAQDYARDMCDDLILNNSVGSGTPFGYYVDTAALSGLASPYQGVGSNLVLAVNGDYELQASEPKNSGIIIAAGNVTLNRSFTGLVICGGSIILNDGAHVQASKSLVSDILTDEYNIGHEDSGVWIQEGITKYLKNFTGSRSSSSVTSMKILEYPDLIHYENWKKNVD